MKIADGSFQALLRMIVCTACFTNASPLRFSEASAGSS
jgi:hypothetical protein